MDGQVLHYKRRNDLKDLIEEIEKAALLIKKWNKTELNLLINLFVKEDDKNSVVCDFDSGEEICSFLKNSQLIAYVHVKFPIGFAKKEFQCFGNHFEKCLHIVQIDDFSYPEWFVEVSILSSIASEISWNAITDAVNPKAFSIDDFRFAVH